MTSTRPKNTMFDGGPPSGPTSTRFVTRHSNTAGDSATIGASTIVASATVKPVRSNSLSPAGSSAALWFIAGPSASVTMLTVNSPRSSRLACVSLRPGRTPLDTMIVGGLPLTALKKEYGARLAVRSSPVPDHEPTHPMGRGTTRPVISL